MDLINATQMQAGYTLGVDPSGREHVVVAIKGTFDFPEMGQDPCLAAEQAPLVEADTFTGEPGKSAPIYEADYPLRKPRCDVLLNGSAYAPGGKPAKKVQVGVKVGPMAKVFNVVGDRTWQSRGVTVIASAPKPFTVMPISYDRAFGGTDDLHPDPKNHSAFMLNPVGCGYHKQTAEEFINGKPLPNTEESNAQVTSPTGKYRPMSFGAVGRGWEPRLKFAGTYDEKWLENTFPFLPGDFQDQFYQAAPQDQQMVPPVGGEQVVLINLTPEGRTTFRLPAMEMPVVFFHRDEDREELNAVADTILFEPDARRLAITWRASAPLKANIFEMNRVIVGRMSRAWWRAIETGKTYYRSLGVLARDMNVDETDEMSEP